MCYLFLPPKIDFKTRLPSLRSTPAFEVGMPVVRAIFCFVCEMPKALFHEKDSPGMPVFDFFAIMGLCVFVVANIRNNPYDIVII